MAWFGIAGSFAGGRWLAILCLSLATAALLVRARRMGDRYPVLLGLLGAAMILCGRFAMASPVLLYSGFGLLLIGLLWSGPVLRLGARS